MKKALYPKWFQRLFGITPWKQEWQKELSETLQKAQRGLNANMVVVVARESDIYSEVLFILSFLGLTLGAITSYFLQDILGNFEEALLIPLAGFSAGATIYSFRRYFLNRLAPRAVKERVMQKAKSQFYDHYSHLQQRLALIYISEIEKEALFLCSPDLEKIIPKNEIQKLLSQMLHGYKFASPLESLKPGLEKIGDSLRASGLGVPLMTTSPLIPKGQLYITASDRQPAFPEAPIIKGNKDIN